MYISAYTAQVNATSHTYTDQKQHSITKETAQQKKKGRGGVEDRTNRSTMAEEARKDKRGFCCENYSLLTHRLFLFTGE